MSAFVEREICVQNLDDESPLTKELTLGLSYRVFKAAEEISPMKPKHSPTNAPFKLCRAVQKHHHRKKKPLCRCPMTISHHTKMSLLDRSVLTQDKYMSMLAIPHRHTSLPTAKPDRRKTKICCKCRLEPCPPRIIQMAIPNKRHVLENWKAFQYKLPAEILARFDQILKSGDNLEPQEARYYFKQLKKKKKMEIRRRKRRCKKRKAMLKRGDTLWLKCQIDQTASAIVDYIKSEPLFMLNYNQMMISDELLRYLVAQKVLCLKSRSTKNVYKKTVIEISDKVVKWMDLMSFFTDIQPLDSKEKIIEIPSLESLLAEEEEEEEEEEEGEGIEFYEEEMAEELRIKEAEEREGMASETSQTSEADEIVDEDGEGFIAEKIVDKTDQFAEGEEGSDTDFLPGLDEDILEKLIKILSESPEDFLLQEIDSENMPGVTYAEVLEKLKEIRDGRLLEKALEKLRLEEKMIEWAQNNDPERVDDKVLDKIHETSQILEDWFKKYGKSMFGDETDKDGIGGRGEDTVEDEIRFVEEWEGDDLFGPRPPDDEYEQKWVDGRDQEGPEGPGGPETDRGPVEGGEDYDEFEEIEKEFIPIDYEDQEGPVPGPKESEGFNLHTDEEGLEGEGIDEEGLGLEGAEEEGVNEEDFAPKGVDEEGLGPEGVDEEALGPKGVDEEGMGPGEGEGLDEGRGGLEEDLEGLDEEEYGEGIEGLEEGEEFGPELGKPEGEEEIEGLDEELGKIECLFEAIRGHKPAEVYEHTPGTICCLSLKIWAVWLLEIANNAHNWTKWISSIIKQVRYYCAVIRGDILLPNGEKKVLYKEEWRKFVAETEEKVIAWRHYSKHVKDLSTEIIENFRGKTVTCCPKCLQDHLIRNVVAAHETMRALTEAINCADYWQRCLDRIVEQTSKITDITTGVESAEEVASLGSEESYTIEIEEFGKMPVPPTPVATVPSEGSYGSVYEIEELPVVPEQGSHFELLELHPLIKPPVTVYEIEEIGLRPSCIKQSSIVNGKNPKPKPKPKPKEDKQKKNKKHK